MGVYTLPGGSTLNGMGLILKFVFLQRLITSIIGPDLP